MSNWPESVTKADLEITYYRGSGPGGQNRNKRDTACRIKHVPTGITAQAQEHKSQEQNKRAAFRRLAGQLVPIMKNEVQKERYRAEFERIRTYNEKYNRVTDSRINGKIFTYSDVVNGKGLDDIINLLKEQENNEDTKT